jgi:hypothetical protein
MAEKKLPFFMKAHQCPVCGSSAEHRQFRNRTYVPATQESDAHVLTYTWHNPYLIQIHPPLYFLYFCPSCYFSATSENYINPAKVPYNRVNNKAFLTARTRKDKVIELLGRRIDYGNISFESALWMHLLAIYAQLLPEEGMRDHYTIARIYLRVAWLYREENAAKTEESKPPANEKPEDLTQCALAEALKEFDGILHQGNEARDRIIAALRADAKQRGEKDADSYGNALGTIDRLFEALHSEAYRLKSTFNRNSTTVLKAGDIAYDTGFLEEVKTLWVYAPIDETEALRSAIEHFEKAIASDARLSDPEPYFRTAALVIDLELRCNDLDAAFKKVRGIIASIMKDRQSIMVRINKTEVTSHKMDLQKLLASANRSIERATDLHYHILDLVIEREMPTITQVLKENAQRTPSEQQDALLAAGISRGIIDRLKARKSF